MKREEAIRQLLKFADKNKFKSDGDGFLSGAIIDALSSPWVSVNERLPENGDLILIKFFTGEDDITDLAHYDVAKGLFYSDGKTRLPNYWMPIPEIDKNDYGCQL